MAVMIDNKRYDLSQSTVDPIVFTGSAPEGQNGYYYAKITEDAITEREPFIRRPIKDDFTPFEFYNRSQIKWEITPMPQIFEPSFKRVQNDLHMEGQISTIHIIGNQSDIDTMHKNISSHDFEVNVNFTFIRGSDMKAFNNAHIKISGRSSLFNPKLSYNLKISKGGDTLYGNRRLKLRALALDPSYVRESISCKVFESAGVATTKFSYVRAIGLFGLVEHLKNPWIRNEFAGGDEKYLQGYLYQAKYVSPSLPDYVHMSDLHYEGDNLTLYGLGQYQIKEEPSDKGSSFQPLADLTKFIADAPADDVAAWERRFDMNSVIRSLVLEIVLGNMDGYNATANNFFLYQDGLNSERFIYIPYDFDLTFGAAYIKLADKLPENSTYPDIHMRPLITQLLRVPQFKHTFDTLLSEFTSKLVNPSVIYKIIDDTVAMIRQDVEWDQGLPRVGFANLTDFAEHIQQVAGTYTEDRYNLIGGLDPDATREALSRKPISFEVAVNGSTGYRFLPGLKEFIANNSRTVIYHDQ
ncbi:coth protein-domain-containing protein [Fennellomyces sp. T-0311]|nr:coth protein-domain-containing protein [Fennellomyces sp. T-0311]